MKLNLIGVSNYFIGLAFASVCAFVGMVLAAPANAQPTKPLVPISVFTDFPTHASVRASPDGKFIAAVVPAGQRRGLVVIDVVTKKGNIIARYNDMDVRSVVWLSNNRIGYTLIDRLAGLGEQVGSGFFAIDKDGKNPKEINPVRGTSSTGFNLSYRFYEFLQRTSGDSPEVYAVGNYRNTRALDLYKLNTLTGKAELLSQSAPLGAAGWILDDDKKPVAVTSYSDDTGNISVYVLGAGERWEKVIEFDRDDQGWTPFEYVKDDKGPSLTVFTNQGRDKVAIGRFDLAKRAITEIIAEHPKFDLGWPGIQSADPDDRGSVTPTVVLRDKAKKVIGLRMELDKPTTLWFDKEWQAWQATIDASLPNRFNHLRKLGETGKLLVHSASDRNPGEYFIFDPTAKTIEELFAAQPAVKEEQMAERKFITYKARDGREIGAYITIPNGSKGKAVPLVVHPHGGPWLRNEYWQWDSESQFFASRGYMVVQPEFRGVQGFGYDHYKAGFKQWGLAMQDDLTDAVLHLAKEGLIDKNKVCIVGGSYGGYAVVMGMVKEPDLFKCGINVVGVTASQYMNEVTWTDFARSKSAEKSLNKVVGDPKTDAAVLAAGNAVAQARKIKGPILHIYGLLDQRVPLINGERMRDAMERAGKKQEWVVYKEEGHGFLLQENRRDYYRRMEKFLAENLN